MDNNEIRDAYREDTVGRKIHKPIMSKKTGFETFKADNEKYTSNVKTFNLKKPCTWAEFIRQSDTTKITYINFLRTEFSVNDKMIGEMMGVGNTSISKECVRLGIGNGHGKVGGIKRKKRTQQQLDAWQEFLCRPVKPAAEEISLAPSKPDSNKQAEFENVKPNIALTSCVTFAKFQQCGKLNIDELMHRITALVPPGEECEIRIEIRQGVAIG